LFIFETSSATPYTFHNVLFPIANTRGSCCPVQNCLSAFDLFIYLFQAVMTFRITTTKTPHFFYASFFTLRVTCNLI